MGVSRRWLSLSVTVCLVALGFGTAVGYPALLRPLVPMPVAECHGTDSARCVPVPWAREITYCGAAFISVFISAFIPDNCARYGAA